MTFSEVTADSVYAALAEFDRVGRVAFLRGARFGRSKAYFLFHNGRLYDSKAIVGYAHGTCTGTRLEPKDFSGDEEAVTARLEALGFQVRYLPNPDWAYEEITLACVLVATNGWRQLDANNERVKELSNLLQCPAIHPLEKRNPDFRNLAGVALKTYNIASAHPAWSKPPTHGNRLDREVLHQFLADPTHMRQVADRHRELFTAATAADTRDLPEPDLEDAAAREGTLALRAHLRRERNVKLRQHKIAQAKRRGVQMACEVCGLPASARGGKRVISGVSRLV
jgi:5-methylcytosine-specific restriction protein A